MTQGYNPPNLLLLNCVVGSDIFFGGEMRFTGSHSVLTDMIPTFSSSNYMMKVKKGRNTWS